MKTVKKPVYYCDHCKKKSFVRSVIEKHEPLCWGNPMNLPACADCIHLTKSQDDHISYQNDQERVTSGRPYPYCKKYGKRLHNQSAIAKGLLEKYPDQFEHSELMPRLCEGQEIWARQTADTFLL